MKIEEEETGIVIEMKYPDGGDLEAGCLEALEQIEKKHYREALDLEEMGKLIFIGIACERKKCRVMTKVEQSAES